MSIVRVFLVVALALVAAQARAATFCEDVSFFVYEVAVMRMSHYSEAAARETTLALSRSAGYEQPIDGLIHWVYRRPAGAPGQVQLDFINQCRAAGLDKGANSQTENQG